MVVDDEEMILEVVTIILKKKGYEVIALSNPLNLLQKIEEHKPDVILLDVQMGEYDGKHLCQSIKEMKEHAHRPVLLFSANKLYKDDIKKFQCDDFIEKPFSIDYFISRINHHAHLQ